MTSRCFVFPWPSRSRTGNLGYGEPDDAKSPEDAAEEILAHQPLEDLGCPDALHQRELRPSLGSEGSFELEPETKPRKLTFMNRLAIVIGLQIGSSIFSGRSKYRSMCLDNRRPACLDRNCFVYRA